MHAIYNVTEIKIVGNRIKEILEDRGSSQVELSKLVGGFTPRQVNRVVLGRCKPGFIFALAIAAALDEPLERVFKIAIKRNRIRRAKE